MRNPDLPLILLGAGTGGFVLASVRRIAVPLPVSLLLAVAARVLFAWVTSRHFTPGDVAVYFRTAGQLALHGHDPLGHMSGRQWNFLPLMPFVFAGEIKSGLPWVYAAKIAPIAADTVVTWEVSRLAGSDARTRALQYALNPLSLLVVSLHGQVEPVALALALGGLMLVERARWTPAGILLGAAIAAKTWPAIIVVAILPRLRRSAAARVLAGAVAAPLAALAIGVAVLDTKPLRAIAHVVSYSSYVYNWGWGGLLVSTGRSGVRGYGSSLGRPGSVITLAAAASVIWLFRRHPPAVRAMVVLCAVLVVTAGFGNQYLLWPLPLMFALAAGPARLFYTVTASAWCAVSYLGGWPEETSRAFLSGLSWLVIATLVWVMVSAFREAPAPAVQRQA